MANLTQLILNVKCTLIGKKKVIFETYTLSGVAEPACPVLGAMRKESIGLNTGAYSTCIIYLLFVGMSV